jgi:putative copper export protein/methionine-rich copper-binding protein CopC
MMRPACRRSLAALLFLSLHLMLAGPLAAHLYLVSSDPADGAALSAVPRELRLRFSEPAELALTQLELLGPDGPVRLGEPTIAADDPNVVIYRVEGALTAGPYTISWRTTSADGHPVRGRLAFSIEEGAEGLPAEPADAPPPPAAVHHDPAVFPEGEGFSAGSPGYVAVRWLTFLGLLGVIGAVAFRLVVLGLVVRRRAPDGMAILGTASGRSAVVGAGFALVLAIAVATRLYTQFLAVHGPGTALSWTSISPLLTRTTWGTGWITQAGATVIVLIGFLLARRLSPAPAEPDAFGAPAGSDGRTVGANMDRNSTLNVGWVLAAIAAVVLAFTPAMGGHAVATPGYAGLAILADGLHVLGAGGWLGSLLAVLVIGIPAALKLGRERRGSAVAELVHAFSPAALFFAALVTITGIIAATLHLGTVGDLWQSEYGRVLLLKVAVLSLLFGTGAYNWLRVRPALGDMEGARRLRRSAGAEVAVGAVVLLITAVLVATPPPAGMTPSDAALVADSSSP